MDLWHESTGDGPAVVFLHAGIADSRMWNPTLPGRRVVRYDLRGYGRSPAPDRPFAHHRDLRDLMDALSIARATLVGASMGGAAAIHFALEWPERVDALVLVGSAVDGYEFRDGPSLARWKAVEAASGAERARLEADLWVPGADPGAAAYVREAILARHCDESLEETQPAIGRLAEIRARTLVMVGDRDLPDVRAVADLLASRIADSKKIVIRGAAHLPSLERPIEFGIALAVFLTSSA